MSTRLVAAASRALDTHTSRRGFLRRAAMVGTALVAAPATYILRPGSAYGAVVPSNCSSGARCNDGWTDFCCNIHGVNTCPPGNVVAGWWRAEGNTFCDGRSRYYMDCNTASCGGCSCGGSGTCSDSCVDCNCQCNHDNCNERKICCTRFRYGQCNNHLPCVGPITCRVVTCVPPWEWDSTCTTTSAVAQSTYSHNAAGLLPDTTPKGPYRARPAVVSGTTIQMRNALTSGGANQTFRFGLPGDYPVIGDFSNSGVRTIGMVRNSRHGVTGVGSLIWFLRQVEGPGEPNLVFEYGRPGDIPVVGDWNGDGVHTVGVVRGNRWLLRNSNRAGDPEIDFEFGRAGDIPVVGDWNGDGRSGIGVVRGNRWILRNTLSAGPGDNDFELPGSGRPVTGDWDGDGRTGVGWFNEGAWTVRNLGASSSTSFTFGSPNGIPLTWGRNA
ncbi:MAG TPA: twin-arginine translocation signal domain-containing protein [Acidimicrobiia bacterium]|nr:twin-arginine translocation signal domain-containing protein [Acidimicrobiia bacterium]